MGLKVVIIKNFRNVVSAQLGVEDNLIISARNKAGKTNTLNAIHWAFTGTTIDGSNDNRVNFTNGITLPIEVTLEFDGLTFTRKCYFEDGVLTNKILLNGIEAKTIKEGEAYLYKQLGLIDLILNKPSSFDVVKFLINPLYFDTIAPKTMRAFMFKMAHVDLENVASSQSKTIQATIKKYGTFDPYSMGETISKEKKKINETLKVCKSAADLFPSVKEEAAKLEANYKNRLLKLEADEAKIKKYAIAVSKEVNDYYTKTMGIEVCLLEEGIGDDVFKDVCYPLSNGVPFELCSYAEKTLVAAKFVNALTLAYKINPLPFLVDNMESLDSNTKKEFDALCVKYIGAAVKEEK